MSATHQYLDPNQLVVLLADPLRLRYHFRCLADGGVLEVAREERRGSLTTYYYVPAPGVPDLELFDCILESTVDD
jgi:hypothetical protein